MKFCPQCKTAFPDAEESCPLHNILLSEIVDLKPGMTIRGSYRIVRKLGEGGFGAVYLAQQTLMEEPRAIKFLARQWARDEGFTARFRREARTLRQVRHPNVVDSGDLEIAEDGSLFFAMEFVDGPDLRDWLNTAQQPIDVALALAVVRAIAEGLGAAHVRGMVHRDIKPENVLMAPAGQAWIPKIADFGIVATRESSTTRISNGGSLLTWAYAAPEQWRGVRGSELDGRTDLYALGALLYEMLTGCTVFDADSYEGWAEQHRNATPRPPSQVRPDLADWPGLDGLVLGLLAKDREERPRDVAELLGLLDGVEQSAQHRQTPAIEEQPHAPVQKSAQPAPHPAVIEPVQTAPAQKEPKPPQLEGEDLDAQESLPITAGEWLRRRPSLRMAAAWLGFAAATALAFFLIQRNLEQAAPAAQSPTAPQSQAANPPPVAQPPAVAFGEFEGTVVDETGAIVPDAAVEVMVTVPGKYQYDVTESTGIDGKFHMVGIPAVGYAKVTAVRAGFMRLQLARVAVFPNRKKHLTLTMRIGSPDQEVVIGARQ